MPYRISLVDKMRAQSYSFHNLFQEFALIQYPWDGYDKKQDKFGGNVFFIFFITELLGCKKIRNHRY